MEASFKVVSLGAAAVSQSLEILAASYPRSFTTSHGLVLAPGAIKNGESVLLSAGSQTVRFATGDTLFEVNTRSFLAHTYSPEWKRPAWMNTLAPAQAPFVFQLAKTLSPWWGPRGSVSTWLETFGAFYCSHRTHIDLAARHAGRMLDGLFGLQSLWMSLFESLLYSMGEEGPEVFHRWVHATDVAPLLGILLGSRGSQEISVEGLPRAIAKLRAEPTPDFVNCMSFAPYPAIVRRAEEGALDLAPVIAKLRLGLGAA